MTNRTAATRYARALLDVGTKEHADLARLESDLSGFVALMGTHPTLGKVLLNPAVPVTRKRGAVAELVARLGVADLVSKLLVLLAERDRLLLLPDLLDAYRERLMDRQNVVRAEVTTAAPIPAERAQQIKQSLAHVTGRTVNLSVRVDPTIIGGLVARVGGTVYDASVTNQLKRLKQRLEESM